MVSGGFRHIMGVDVMLEVYFRWLHLTYHLSEYSSGLRLVDPTVGSTSDIKMSHFAIDNKTFNHYSQVLL